MIEEVAIALGRRVKMRGMGRLLSYLYPIGISSPRYVDDIRFRADGMRVAVDTRELIDWEMLFHGGYEVHIGMLFERLIKPGDIVADIGANVGAHTLTLARLVGNGKVLAFEPNPQTRNKLLRNLELNKLNQVRVFSCALGREEAQMSLRVPRLDSAEGANPGIASLMALDTPHDLVPVVVSPFDQIVRIHQLLRLDLVKIDVQGFEESVFLGMKDSLHRHHPIIVFEFEDWAWSRSGSDWERVRSLLFSLGYSLFGLSPRDKEQKIIPIDLSNGPLGHMDLLAVHASDPRRRELGIADGDV